MNRLNPIIFFVFFTVALTGCSNKFKYFGNTYEPTKNVKIYFREGDIDQPFEVMGKLYASFKTDTRDSKVQRKIMDKVKQHGGDAAVFGDMSVHVAGSVTSGSGAATQAGNKSVVGGSVSTTKNLEKDEMEITVIKFKAANP